jgi:Fe-S-cluster containining protein
MKLETNLTVIAKNAETKDDVNWNFRTFLKQKDSANLDKIVHQLNQEISSKIDCTTCGNCCKSLMINVTDAECKNVSTHLKMDEPVFKEKYIEVSAEGAMIMNTIPCNFLEDKKCTIYNNRFTECRDFPHLHKSGFQQRLMGTLMYYGTCPIVYNVIEQLKIKMNYID